MRRVTSMVFIGGWAGFFGTVSAAASLAIVSAGFPQATRLPIIGEQVGRIADLLVANGNFAVLAAAGAAFVFAAVMLLLVLAMWLLQGEEGADRSAGERLAVATLGFAAVVICGLGLAGVNLLTDEVSVGGIALVLALSIVALLFDRLIEIDEAAEAEEENFYRNALVLGRSMGRDAAFPPPSEDSTPEARR